jgi:hypothetical protein
MLSDKAQCVQIASWRRILLLQYSKAASMQGCDRAIETTTQITCAEMNIEQS